MAKLNHKLKRKAPVRRAITRTAAGRATAKHHPQAPAGDPAAFHAMRKAAPPAHVTILGLGPSAEAYMDHVKRVGGRSRFCDEVWTINALGDVLACDLIFHMDDVRIQQIRADANPHSNIAAMLRWLKAPAAPVITSRPHPDYPALVPFPLEAAFSELGMVYANNTAAWALIYALWIGVKELSLYGMDFTYPNAHNAEKGRGCVEFWLGVAHARGVKIALPERTSLMDTIHGPASSRLYGYDTLDVTIADRPEGGLSVALSPKAKLPTALEIERAYDHSRHPNPLAARA